MQNKNTIIEDLISKIISIGTTSYISNGQISLDYRMFCDLISIARNGCKNIKDKKSDYILHKLENNTLSNINIDTYTELMSIVEYKKLKYKKGENNANS